MRGKQWMTGSAAVLALAALIVSCGGTGGGGGSKGGVDEQFIRNSSNAGRLTLLVDPSEVDANKSDRIGLVAILTDNAGRGIVGVPIAFSTDLGDVTFIPGDPPDEVTGTAVTDSNGRADIIAVAGATPTGTGAIIGTGAIFATAPQAFGLRAQVQITLLDVGFIDADVLGVIPSQIDLGNPTAGTVLFFTVIGGTPPYALTNQSSGIGTGSFGQKCLPGCTENGGLLCIGSPCQIDNDCNANGSATPAGVCLGPIKRCLASCAGSNCAGARCATDSDCNDGSPTPANVCKDSGQSLSYIVAVGCGNGRAESTAGGEGAQHDFQISDSAGGSVSATVVVSLAEQCDGSDLAGATCQSVDPIFTGGTLGCTAGCSFDTSGCTTSTPGGGFTPGPGATFTPGGGVPTPTATPANGATPGPVQNLSLALLSLQGANNGNGTATTVISAIASDSNGNPVEDGTAVQFSIANPTNGAVITTESQTGSLPPQCDIQNYESATGIPVLQQPGIAHACITYSISVCSQCCAPREPSAAFCSNQCAGGCGGSFGTCESCSVSVGASSGLSAGQSFTLPPVLLLGPIPTPTP